MSRPRIRPEPATTIAVLVSHHAIIKKVAGRYGIPISKVLDVVAMSLQEDEFLNDRLREASKEYKARPKATPPENPNWRRDLKRKEEREKRKRGELAGPPKPPETPKPVDPPQPPAKPKLILICKSRESCAELTFNPPIQRDPKAKWASMPIEELEDMIGETSIQITELRDECYLKGNTREELQKFKAVAGPLQFRIDQASAEWHYRDQIREAKERADGEKQTVADRQPEDGSAPADDSGGADRASKPGAQTEPAAQGKGENQEGVSQGVVARSEAEAGPQSAEQTDDQSHAAECGKECGNSVEKCGNVEGERGNIVEKCGNVEKAPELPLQ